MTVLQITCDNCGAKYKLPETFTGAHAKCQKCGSVIDVAKQRAAATGAAPATPAPAAKPAAAAKPAVDRSKAAPASEARPAARPATTAKPAAAKPASSRLAARKGKDEAADDDAPAGRRERGERKKDSTMPILLAAVGLLAVAGGAFFLLSGGETPTAAEPAKAEQAKVEPPKAEAPKAEAPKAEAPKAEAPKAAEPAKAETPAAAPAAATPPAAETPPAAAPEDAGRPKKPWERMKNPPASMADVADPKSYGEVKWPASIDDAKKAELRELAEQAAGDGIRSTRAKNKLQETGWAGIFAIVEQLQKLDYKEVDPSMVGFDLNKLLETITGGVNVRFEPVDASESLAPAKAEWNTRTVKVWIDWAGNNLDEEAYNKARAERLKKAGGDK